MKASPHLKTPDAWRSTLETLEKQNKCSIMIILYIVFNIKLRTSHTHKLYHFIVDPIISQNWEVKKKAEQWQQLNGKTASHVYGLIHIPGVSQLAVPSTSEEHRHLYWDKASKPQRVTNQRYSIEHTKTFQTLEFSRSNFARGMQLILRILKYTTVYKSSATVQTTSRELSPPRMIFSEYFRTKPPRLWQQLAVLPPKQQFWVKDSNWPSWC